MITSPVVSVPFGARTEGSGPVLRILLLGALLLVPTIRAADSPVLVLESGREEQSPRLEGPKEWADEEQCLASTFKVFLSWVALEEGLAKPEDRRMTRDSHVPASPREITLHQAMYYSSNDYFVGLMSGVPLEKLDHYLLRSGLVGPAVPKDWFTTPRSLVSGGSLRVSPRASHAFMRRVAFGTLGSTPEIQQQLEAVLRWPGPIQTAGDQNRVPAFYGKTGVFGGAVWFNGFIDMGPDQRRVVTVFLPGSVPERPRAIGAFYARAGLAWDKAWSDWLER